MYSTCPARTNLKAHGLTSTRSSVSAGSETASVAPLGAEIAIVDGRHYVGVYILTNWALG